MNIENLHLIIEDIVKYTPEFIYVPLYDEGTKSIIDYKQKPIDVLHSYITLLEEIEKRKAQTYNETK